MAKSKVKVDVKELTQFTQRLEQAANEGIKQQYGVWLEAIGMEFLGIVQDEIIRLGVVDTRRLLNSFSRGNSDCVFETSGNSLILTIGTNVEYASFVNDGHWAGAGRRAVTGYWDVKTRWVEGYHYFDVSIAIFEKIVAASMEKKMTNWLKGVVGGQRASR